MRLSDMKSYALIQVYPQFCQVAWRLQLGRGTQGDWWTHRILIRSFTLVQPSRSFLFPSWMGWHKHLHSLNCYSPLEAVRLLVSVGLKVDGARSGRCWTCPSIPCMSGRQPLYNSWSSRLWSLLQICLVSQHAERQQDRDFTHTIASTPLQ